MAEFEKSPSIFIPKKFPQFMAAACASLAPLSLGTVLGWPSPVLPTLIQHGLDLDYHEGNETHGMANDTRNATVTMEHKGFSVDQASWIASLAILGCVLSTIPAGFFINSIGRRMTIIVLAIPLFLGWVLIIIADSVRLLYVGRFITGFCGGAFSIAVPVYIGEIASNEYRGQLLSFFTLQLVHGILFSYVKGSMVNWMWLSVFCASIPLVLAISMYFMPNSPIYLLSMNKVDEATASLKWLRGAKDVKQIEPELKTLQLNQENSDHTELKMRDYLDSSIWKPLGLCIAIHILQQLSGIAIAVVYCSRIFLAAGSTLSPSTSIIIVGVAQVIGVTVSGALIDRAGRRILLIISCLLMMACWVPLGVCFYLREQNGGILPEELGLLPLISLVGVVVCFSIGLGPIPWTLLGELLPNQVRGSGASYATFFNWLLSFFIVKIYDSALSEYMIFFIFSGFCVISAVFTYVALPETKNKTYEDIQANFSSSKGSSSKM